MRTVTSDVLYDDGKIACDEDGLILRWYYPWGSKRIPYRTVRSARTFQLGPVRGKWRIWGSGDFVHWYNLDWERPKKEIGIELDVGGHVLPCVTPDDPNAVSEILAGHMSS
jgi:hypothetical protein